jgi:hypothetical protein
VAKQEGRAGRGRRKREGPAGGALGGREERLGGDGVGDHKPEREAAMRPPSGARSRAVGVSLRARCHAPMRTPPPSSVVAVEEEVGGGGGAMGGDGRRRRRLMGGGRGRGRGGARVCEFK